jgi:hypothetical protein
MNVTLLSADNVNTSTKNLQSNTIEQNMPAEDFFKELITRLDINIEGLENYTYCTPYIAYLVDKGYISPYQTQVIAEGRYNSGFLIDKGLLLVEYYERPLDKGEYFSIIDRTLKETKIVDVTFDCSKKLTYTDGINIINRIVNDDFVRKKYSIIDMKIKYKIDNFYNMSTSIKKTLHYINMIPQNCINEFNRRGFKLHIVENAVDAHPYNRRNVVAFTNFSTNTICIMRGFEQDIVHEFGHLMFSKIINKKKVCEYLYSHEGKYGPLFGNIEYDDKPEEYCADVFASYILYQHDEKYIKKLQEYYPMIYGFIQNILSRDEVKFYINISNLK